MIPFTEDNPEGFEHGRWEQERVRLLGERYLHVTDDGEERWFEEPQPLCLGVGIVRMPERGDEYWVWTRTGSVASEVMRRLVVRLGWVVSSHCAGSDLWTRPVSPRAGAR